MTDTDQTATSSSQLVKSAFRRKPENECTAHCATLTPPSSTRTEYIPTSWAKQDTIGFTEKLARDFVDGALAAAVLIQPPRQKALMVSQIEAGLLHLGWTMECEAVDASPFLTKKWLLQLLQERGFTVSPEARARLLGAACKYLAFVFAHVNAPGAPIPLGPQQILRLVLAAAVEGDDV